MSYIIITPAKNEELFLPITANSVLKQTQIPKLWLIIDDGSTDDTPNVIEKLTNNYRWIISIQLPPHPRDLFFHYSFVCNKGFNYIINYCELNRIDYEYIGLVDADTELEPSYFRKLIEEFKTDSHLGIASGSIHDKQSDKKKSKVIVYNDGYLPRGTGRLWTKKCFIESEGYKIEAAAHSISNVKAILRGYSIKKFDDIVAVQQRETRSADGLWKTYQKDGWLAYYLNKHPVLVLLNCVHYTFCKPFYLGIPYFLGYIIASSKNEGKILDIEIKDYYWNIRLREVIMKIFL